MTSVDAVNLQAAGGTCAFESHKRERRPGWRVGTH